MQNVQHAESPFVAWASPTHLRLRPLTRTLRVSTPRREFDSYSGPEIPPSLRMRQKWMAISTVTITGINTQCST